MNRLLLSFVCAGGAVFFGLQILIPSIKGENPLTTYKAIAFVVFMTGFLVFLPARGVLRYYLGYPLGILIITHPWIIENVWPLGSLSWYKLISVLFGIALILISTYKMRTFTSPEGLEP